MRKTSAPILIIICITLFAAVLFPQRLNLKEESDRVLAYQMAVSHLSIGEEYINQARELYNKGDRRKASNILEEAQETLEQAEQILEELTRYGVTDTVYLSLAETQMLAGQPSKAYRTYIRIIEEINQECLPAYIELGKFELNQNGDLKLARIYFAKALEVDKKSPEALFFLGYITFQGHNDYAQAKAYLEEFLNVDSGTNPTFSIYSKLYLGAIAYNNNEFENCIDYLEALPYEYFNKQEQRIYHIAISTSYQIYEQYEKSYIHAQKLNKVAEKSLANLYTLALRAELADKESGETLDEIDKMSDFYTKEPFYISAIKELKNGRTNEANSIIKTYLKKNRTSVTASQLYYKLNPNDKLAKGQLIYVYIYANINKPVIKHIEEMIEDGEKSLYHALSDVYYSIGNKYKAIEAAYAYIDADINHKYSNLWQIANLALEEDNYKLGHRAVDKIIEIEHAPSAILRKASFFALEEKYDEAENGINECLTKISEEDEITLSKAYNEIAGIYLLSKKTNNAIDFFTKSLDYNGSNVNALNSLGYVYIDTELNVEKGIELVKRALKILPNNPNILDSLGWGYYKSQDYDNALTTLQYVVKNNDITSAIIYEHLADVYVKKGLKKEAIETYKKALMAEEKGVDFDEDNVRRKIEQLKAN